MPPSHGFVCCGLADVLKLIFVPLEDSSLLPPVIAGMNSHHNAQACDPNIGNPEVDLEIARGWLT